MGNTSYDQGQRVYRASVQGYATKSLDQIFEQNAKREMHKDMNPNGVKMRECRDSKEHPNATPIQLYLDHTGSMGTIPHELIKDGLPKLMSSLIENGVADAALMFAAVGDHKCDHCPLQVGQFESGDAELDMWLTRVYLEGNGGGNGGESYPLAWYFAAFHTATDSFEKRKKKGFVFTVGDEPFHNTYPLSAIKGIMGDTAVGEGSYTAEQLLAEAQKKNHVYHIHVLHNGASLDPRWSTLLGENVRAINDPATLPRVISDIVLSHVDTPIIKPSVKPDETPSSL